MVCNCVKKKLIINYLRSINHNFTMSEPMFELICIRNGVYFVGVKIDCYGPETGHFVE